MEVVNPTSQRYWVHMRIRTLLVTAISLKSAVKGINMDAGLVLAQELFIDCTNAIEL